MIVPRSILDDGTSPPITEPRHLVEKNNSPHNPATFTKHQRDSNMDTSPPRLIRLPDVIAKTGLCRSTIYNRFKINPSRPADYDPTFPPPIKLGVRSVAWVEAEIDRWVLSRIEATRSPNAAQEKTRHACKHMAGGIILPLG